MPKIIDLSQPVSDGGPVFPGDPEVKFYTHHTHESVGYRVTRFEMGTHTGTHLDVPLHKLPGGASVSEIPLSQFMGRAYVADMTMLEPGEEVAVAHLSAHEAEMAGCTTLILKTGWASRYGQGDFFSGFNGISEAAAKWIVAKGFSLIALESPSVHPVKHQEIHTILLESGVIVVETICNVDAIQKPTVWFCAAPLKLIGLDGSPVRAFVIED